MEGNVHKHDRALESYKRLAAEFFEREANPTPLITVTNAALSSDKKAATIFITVLPESRADEALKFGERRLGDLREYVRERLRTRLIPTFSLKFDEGEAIRRKIDELT